MIILEKYKFIPLLSNLLIDKITVGDYHMKILILRAINNFINMNARDLLKDKQPLQEILKYIDEVINPNDRKPILDEQIIAIRSLFIIKTSLFMANID